MNPSTKEARTLRAELARRFPQVSQEGLKKATHAFLYGATPARVAGILKTHTSPKKG